MGGVVLFPTDFYQIGTLLDGIATHRIAAALLRNAGDLPLAALISQDDTVFQIERKQGRNRAQES